MAIAVPDPNIADWLEELTRAERQVVDSMLAVADIYSYDVEVIALHRKKIRFKGADYWASLSKEHMKDLRALAHNPATTPAELLKEIKRLRRILVHAAANCLEKLAKALISTIDTFRARRNLAVGGGVEPGLGCCYPAGAGAPIPNQDRYECEADGGRFDEGQDCTYGPGPGPHPHP